MEGGQGGRELRHWVGVGGEVVSTTWKGSSALLAQSFFLSATISGILEGPGTGLAAVFGVRFSPPWIGSGGLESFCVFLAEVIKDPGVFSEGSSKMNWTSSRLTEESPTMA